MTELSTSIPLLAAWIKQRIQNWQKQGSKQKRRMITCRVKWAKSPAYLRLPHWELRATLEMSIPPALSLLWPTKQTGAFFFNLYPYWCMHTMHRGCQFTCPTKWVLLELNHKPRGSQGRPFWMILDWPFQFFLRQKLVNKKSTKMSSIAEHRHAIILPWICIVTIVKIQIPQHFLCIFHPENKDKDNQKWK